MVIFGPLQLSEDEQRSIETIMWLQDEIVRIVRGGVWQVAREGGSVMDRIEAFERIMEAQQRLNKAESEVFALEMELEESDLGRRMESAKEERKRAKKALGNVMYDVSIAYQLELPMRGAEQKRSVIVGKRPEQVNTVTGEIEPAPETMQQATLGGTAVGGAVAIARKMRDQLAANGATMRLQAGGRRATIGAPEALQQRVFGEHDPAANEQTGKPDFETWRAEALGSSA